MTSYYLNIALLYNGNNYYWDSAPWGCSTSWGPTNYGQYIAWLTPPTDAQRRALLAILSDFRQNHPTISFSEGAPLMHAAVDNA